MNKYKVTAYNSVRNAQDVADGEADWFEVDRHGNLCFYVEEGTRKRKTSRRVAMYRKEVWLTVYEVKDE